LRKRAGLARFASLITLLALVVAPACAPLCAAQTCTQAPASTEMGSHCHSHEVANSSAAYLHAVQSCGAAEFQAANMPSAEKRRSLQKVRAEVSPGAVGVSSPGHFSPSAPISTFTDVDPHSPPDFCFALSKVVLRI